MILIAIGGNLPAVDGPPARVSCERAAGAVADLPGLAPVALSPWYRTAPIPRADQPDYCNGMLRLEGEADPEALLAALHRIETQFGRQRHAINAARTLDLDLIEMNGLIRNPSSPVLPHPRAHLRAFVLRPILDIAPDWVHPVLKLDAARLLAGIAGQIVVPWDQP
jgi:2-amino-4-hydroxy-6-hydroxymethyldihydropteridine diphosphokinase